MFNWFKNKPIDPPDVQKARKLEAEVREGFGGEDALAAYASLTRLAQTQLQFPDIRRLLANAAVNLVRRCIHEQLEEDRAVLAMITQLAADHSDEGIIRECLVHLIWEYAARVANDDTDQLRKLYQQQRELYDEYADARKHPSPLVKLAMRLMTGHHINGNISEARDLHTEIVSLANRHLDDSEVLRDRAGSSLNLIARLVTVDDMGPREYELGRTYLEELDDFATNFPHSASLQEMVDQARGYFVE